MKAFFRDRLNAAWAASALVLIAVLVFVPNTGVGTLVMIGVAVVVIGLSGAARIRDARRDRERGPRRRR